MKLNTNLTLKKMKKFNITALGTGSAFCLKNYQSNFLIEINDKKLLLDCGGDIRFALKDIGLSYKDIDSIYISHAHADHIGGLEYFAFCSMFDTTKEKITLFSEKYLLQEVWANSLRGSLEAIEGKLVTISDYFNIINIEPNQGFTFEGVNFELVQTVHVAAKFKIVPSYGLIFTEPDGKRIFWTSDTQFCPETYMKAAYKEADLILHDCETSPYKSGVHANYIDLVNLPKETRNKMLLYHYQDNVVNDYIKWQNKAWDDEFIGFIKKGEKII